MKVMHFAVDGNEIAPIIQSVRDFLAQGAERVEIVAVTRGAVSHCDIEAQDEPMWQVRAEFPIDRRPLATPTPGLFSEE